MTPRIPWQRRELIERAEALETLLNQEALSRVTMYRPERKRNQASIDWLRRELALVREHLNHV
jgi:hypothetical protein